MLNLLGAPITVAANVIFQNPSNILPSIASVGSPVGTGMATIANKQGQVGKQGQVTGNGVSIPTVVFANPS